MILEDPRRLASDRGTSPHRSAPLTATRGATPGKAWRILKKHDTASAVTAAPAYSGVPRFRLEDSQIATADRLLKLVAIAAKAAVITIQLLQARDGRSHLPVRLAFDSNEVATLAALNQNLEAQTKRLKNPHPPDNLAWAASIPGPSAGGECQPASKPPGPITMKHGLEYFYVFAAGWSLRDVCMP